MLIFFLWSEDWVWFEHILSHPIYIQGIFGLKKKFVSDNFVSYKSLRCLPVPIHENQVIRHKSHVVKYSQSPPFVSFRFFVSTTWIPFGPENASNVAAKSDLAFDRRDILYFVSRMQVGDKELDSLITKSFSSQTFFVPFFFFFFFPFLFLFSSFFW